mgnify:CR=1 FL=1
MPADQHGPGSAEAPQPAALRRFILPSLGGAAMFLVPIYYDGAWTIALGIVTDSLTELIGAAMPSLLLTIISLSTILSLAPRFLPAWQQCCTRSPLGRVFIVPNRWLLLRVLGALCAWLIVFQAGPEFIWSDNTGGVALYQLAGQIVSIFLCAAFLLPMLTDFGLMEFVGTLLQPVFQRLFTLPGRAAVDALASWLSSAGLGVLLTVSQYERGFYTRREAIVIASNFSVTSLPFCLFVIGFVGLREHFFPAYATVILIGLSCAVLLPRLPPFRSLDRGGKSAAPASSTASDVPRQPLVARALAAARQRATHAPTPSAYLRSSLQFVLDMLMGLLPLVVLIGTLGLAIAEFTPAMQYLARPIAPLLTWMGVPEASAAAPALIVGFLDMFLPAVIAQGIDSEFTRFVVAAVSLSQLIYLSEVGALLLRSSLNVGLPLLLLIFALRTVIALPIAIACAHLFLGT